MRAVATRRAVRVHAFAKINLGLRVLGARPDGYHELRTTFQSIALHDTLVFRRVPGPFRIECRDPACPTDRTNLVWRAAAAVWRLSRRRGRMRDLVVAIEKRIPVQGGLGGGSSDAAATLRALSKIWRADLDEPALRRIALRLGADVPYFLEGGTMLGVERGDLLFPLVDVPPAWVVLVLPGFGVSTKDAFGWFDRDARGHRALTTARAADVPDQWRSVLPLSDRINDLERPVSARHRQIRAAVRGLRSAGASHAAMTGSGSTVFGVFASRDRAVRAADLMSRVNRRGQTIVTRTLTHAQCRALAAK
jgi:4-diphosphocytidyl-2-C-methyl-D-erythritol kinase